MKAVESEDSSKMLVVGTPQFANPCFCESVFSLLGRSPNARRQSSNLELANPGGPPSAGAASHLAHVAFQPPRIEIAYPVNQESNSQEVSGTFLFRLRLRMP